MLLCFALNAAAECTIYAVQPVHTCGQVLFRFMQDPVWTGLLLLKRNKQRYLVQFTHGGYNSGCILGRPTIIDGCMGIKLI